MAEKNEFSSLLRRIRIISASRRVMNEHRNSNAELSILNVVPKIDGKIEILYRAFDGRDYTDVIEDPREIDLGILERIVDWIVEYRVPRVEKKRTAVYDPLRSSFNRAEIYRDNPIESSVSTPREAIEPGEIGDNMMEWTDERSLEDPFIDRDRRSRGQVPRPRNPSVGNQR